MKRLLFLSILFGLFASASLAENESDVWYKKTYIFGSDTLNMQGFIDSYSKERNIDLRVMIGTYKKRHSEKQGVPEYHMDPHRCYFDYLSYFNNLSKSKEAIKVYTKFEKMLPKTIKSSKRKGCLIITEIGMDGKLVNTRLFVDTLNVQKGAISPKKIYQILKYLNGQRMILPPKSLEPYQGANIIYFGPFRKPIKNKK